LHATCESGVGGKHEIDWGGGAKGSHTIVIWKPNVHLRTESNRAELAQLGSGEPAEPYATDWYLESEGGITRVRMVASGFGEGPSWDHEYDGTFHGWDMFHKTLTHYLEHHRGKAAHNVVIYAMLAVSTAEAWKKLMSPEGLVKEGRLDDLSIGAPFRFVTAGGDVFAGEVRGYVPGKTFTALVENLNKSILNIEMATVPGSGAFLYLALSTWGLPKAEVDALGARIKSIVYGLFPQQSGEPKSACAGDSAGAQ
jgi:hypothetical protein